MSVDQERVIKEVAYSRLWSLGRTAMGTYYWKKFIPAAGSAWERWSYTDCALSTLMMNGQADWRLRRATNVVGTRLERGVRLYRGKRGNGTCSSVKKQIPSRGSLSCSWPSHTHNPPAFIAGLPVFSFQASSFLALCSGLRIRDLYISKFFPQFGPNSFVEGRHYLRCLYENVAVP